MDKEYLDKVILQNSLFTTGSFLYNKVKGALSDQVETTSHVKIVEDTFVVNESDYLAKPRRVSNYF
jgi:hypothetical protein